MVLFCVRQEESFRCELEFLQCELTLANEQSPEDYYRKSSVEVIVTYHHHHHRHHRTFYAKKVFAATQR